MVDNADQSYMMANFEFKIRHILFLRLIVPQPVDGHVILLDEHWNVKLGGVYDRVKLFNLMDIVQLVFDSWGHEGGEPPAGQPGPHAGVHCVEVLEVLLVVVRQLGVDLLHPPVTDHVFTASPATEVHHRVIFSHHGVQNSD